MSCRTFSTKLKDLQALANQAITLAAIVVQGGRAQLFLIPRAPRNIDGPSAATEVRLPLLYEYTGNVNWKTAPRGTLAVAHSCP